MKTPNTQGLPVTEAMQKLKQFESTMTYEQLQDYKRTQLRPFRARNMLLAGAIWTGVIAVYSFSMYKTSRDDFTTFDTTTKSSPESK